MKRKLVYFIIIFSMVFSFVGCTSVPDMSDAQAAKISNYATALLLKYDANYESRLVDTAAIEEERAIEAAKDKQRLEEEAARQAAYDAEQAAKSVDTSVPEVVVDSYLDIATTLSFTDVSINYAYMELSQAYPEDTSNDFLTPVRADVDSQLLVLHFTLTNLSMEDKVISINDTKAVFQVYINGTIQRNVLSTLLLNDFAYFEDTLSPGEMVDLVAICEITNEQSTSIESLILGIKYNGESFRAKLQ